MHGEAHVRCIHLAVQLNQGWPGCPYALALSVQLGSLGCHTSLQVCLALHFFALQPRSLLPVLQGQCGDQRDNRHLYAVPDADGVAGPAAAAIAGVWARGSQPDGHPGQPEAAQLHHRTGRADIPGCGARIVHVIAGATLAM